MERQGSGAHIRYVTCSRKFGKSQMFDELLDELSSFKKWLPGFKLTYSLFLYGQIHAVFRSKSTAAASANIREERALKASS